MTAEQPKLERIMRTAAFSGTEHRYEIEANSMTQETEDVVAALDGIEAAVRTLDWKAPVPDELQSAIRMAFNEALAGGPNMNGDGGPTLTPNHALDCVWATRRIQSLSDRIDELGSEATARNIVAVVLARTRADGGRLRCDATGAINAVRAALHQEGIDG